MDRQEAPSVGRTALPRLAQLCSHSERSVLRGGRCPLLFPRPSVQLAARRLVLGTSNQRSLCMSTQQRTVGGRRKSWQWHVVGRRLFDTSWPVPPSVGCPDTFVSCRWGCSLAQSVIQQTRWHRAVSRDRQTKHCLPTAHVSVKGVRPKKVVKLRYKVWFQF